MSSYGEQTFQSIKKYLKRCPTNKDVLQYLFDKNITIPVSNLESFEQLKKQHIIKYLNSFYRKVGGLNQIYDICKDTDIILIDIAPTSGVINIDQTNVNQLTYLSIPIKIYKKDTIVFHGTTYQMPKATDHMPYNWVGNWFGTNESESKAYMFVPESRLYKYKVLKDFNLIDISEENSLNYFLVHVAFMETVIDNINENILSLVKYARGRQTTEIPMIEKYNYTIGKNLLNTTGTNQYGLYDRTNLTKVADDFLYPISIASSGDGDKPLAGAICDIYNSKDPNSITVNGWEIPDIRHLMICNPIEVLVNISGENLDGKVVFKSDPEYDNFFKKYLKYKSKYLKLKQILKN
jgi:hypothetical protein